MTIQEKLVLHILKNYILLKEIPGSDSSPTILNWIRKYFPKENDDSKVAWCSIGLKSAIEDLNLDICLPLVNPSAISWKNLKYQVPLDKLEFGDILVFKRGSLDWQHHVCIYIRTNKRTDKLIVLGFNQSDSVTFEEMDISKLKYARRLKLCNEVLI